MIAQIIVQLSIAIASITALTRRESFWYFSLASFLVGLVLFVVEVLA